MSDKTEAGDQRPEPGEAFEPLTLEQRRFLAIVMAEYAYWRNANIAEGKSELSDIADGITMGAVGATANIVAALAGHPSEWHKAALAKLEAQLVETAELVL